MQSQSCLHGIGPASVRNMISKIKGRRDGDHDVRFDDLLQVVMEFQKKKDAASILGT
jgi:hypothetical protein